MTTVAASETYRHIALMLAQAIERLAARIEKEDKSAEVEEDRE